jgi:hypothetical protein
MSCVSRFVCGIVAISFVSCATGPQVTHVYDGPEVEINHLAQIGFARGVRPLRVVSIDGRSVEVGARRYALMPGRHVITFRLLSGRAASFATTDVSISFDGEADRQYDIHRMMIAKTPEGFWEGVGAGLFPGWGKAWHFFWIVDRSTGDVVGGYRPTVMPESKPGQVTYDADATKGYEGRNEM